MLLRSGQKFMINEKKMTTLTKKLDLKHQCLDQIYVILAMRIVVKGNITLEGASSANKDNKKLAFKNNAPFINCISKINGSIIDNAEDLDVVMPMHNFLE